MPTEPGQLQMDGVPAALDVVTALRTLPERDQLVLTLIAWEELSVAQIAEVVGSSVVATRVRIHRARRRLRRQLGEEAAVMTPSPLGEPL